MTRMLRAAVGVAMLTTGLSNPATAGTLATSMTVGESCVAVHDTPAADEARLRDENGVLKDTTTLEGPPFRGCFPTATIQPTDRVILRRDGQWQRTVVVPLFTISVNRGTDVIDGMAPAGASVSFIALTCDAIITCSTGASDDVVANEEGAWSLDVSGTMDLKGFDRVRARTQIGGDQFDVDVRVPYLEATVGKAVVRGGAVPKASVTSRLIRGRTERARITKTADILGAFRGKLRKSGSEVAVAVDDRVKANLVPPVVLDVEITLRVVRRQDRIVGHCVPGSTYGVWLADPDGASGFGRAGSLNGAGDVTVTTIELGDKVGWALTFICMNPRGDRILLTKRIS